MNPKQFLLLVIAVVIVGAGGLYLRHRSQADYQATNQELGHKLLGDFQVNDVARVTLKQGASELNLVKKDGTWRVHERGDYPANFSEISDFLVKAGDVKIMESQKVGASQLSRFQLGAGQGTNSPLQIEFKDQNDKTLRTVWLGKKLMQKSNQPSPFGDSDMGWPKGRYVKLGDSGNVLLISEAFANIEPKPEQWLNKDFFKIEKVRSIAVTYPTETNSWKIARETETGEWKLADAKPGETLDATKASGVASPLSSLNFSDISTSTDSLAKASVAVGTFDDFLYTLKTGQKTNDNFPFSLTLTAQLAKERTPGKDEKPEDKDKLDKEFKEKQKKLEEKLAQEKTYEGRIYLAPNWPLESILKDRSQLLVEKKEEPKKDDKPAGDPPQVLAPPIPQPVPPVPEPAPVPPPSKP